MSLRTLSDPDCSGMCSCGITLGVSAMASMTSSVKAAGCGLVKRTRSRPSICPQARSSLPKASGRRIRRRRSSRSGPAGSLRWRRRRPAPGSRRGSPRAGGRVPCRAATGTMQNVQVLLQPTEIDTQPAYTESRLVGRVEGKTSRDSRISSCGLVVVRGRAPAGPAGSRCCGCRRPRRPRGPCFRMVSRSFWARQPPTAICMSGRFSFTWASMPRLP